MSPEDEEQLRRVARRSAPWFGGVLLFVLLSIPAIFDLQTLFVGLAVICGLLGLVTALFTWFDRSAGDRA